MKFLGILEFLNLEFLNLRIPGNSRILNLEFPNLEFLGILNFSFKRIKNELFLQKKVFA